MHLMAELPKLLNSKSLVPVEKFQSCRRPSADPTTTLFRYVSGCAIQVGWKSFPSSMVTCVRHSTP